MPPLLKAKLVTLPSRISERPNRCAVTRRPDGEMIDTGVFFEGRTPARIYLRRGWFEYVARELLGMVSQKKLAGVEAERDDAVAEAARLREIVTAEEKLRAALGPAPETAP